MRKAAKGILIAIAIGASLFFGYQFYDRQFKLGNITTDWPAKNNPELSHDLKTQLEQIFNQPFAYLDRGKQSYVFVSRDNDYVVKFFDTRCLRSGAFPLLASLDEEKCKKKLRRLVKGFKTALTYDKGHNGIVYAQLAPDPAFDLKASIIDRFGISHEIDLSKVPFVLQRKAVPLREVITGLLSRGNVKEAERRYRQVIDMYVDGYRRGIFDRDHNFMYNTGFLGDEPIRIDVGRLYHSEAVMETGVFMKDLEKVAIKRLGEWLHRHFPQYRDEIVKDATEKLQEVSRSSPD